MSTTELIEKSGLLETVYSFVMPETEALIEEVLGCEEHRSELRERHRNAWTGKQDAYHQSFFNKWVSWVRPAVNLYNLSSHGFHRYPTAGSSEGIREVFAYHASISNYRPAHGLPVLHVIAGEYEGYKAYAEAYGMRVIEHEGRRHWQITESIEASLESLGVNGTGHLFFISQPSSVNGMLWDNEELLKIFGWLKENTGIRVGLDLCYVGTIDKEAVDRSGKIEFPLNQGAGEVVDYVCFSLSKVFGVYYHRIGGLFSRHELPGLYGNKWFKNLTSMYLGEQLMDTYSVFELPGDYKHIQQQAIDEIKDDLIPSWVIERPGGGFHPEPSDVFILAHEKVGNYNLLRPFQQRVVRGGRKYGSARYCLTKKMHEIATREGLYTESKGDTDA